MMARRHVLRKRPMPGKDDGFDNLHRREIV
jgi:hypothetical protein